jgi:hypothetical protein
MCDNCKGWGNFAENALGITWNVCQTHATRSHVKQFPSVAAYDDYYNIVVDAGEIGVEQFATLVQIMLVEYLRVHRDHCDDIANWCEKYWTGCRGRYCFVHSRYAGCNNIMSVEVSWRDIKKVCNTLSPLGVFIEALCHFIAQAVQLWDRST